MAEIIRFDSTQKGPGSGTRKLRRGCRHREVTAYTASRTVFCSFCGAQLDPFDVLVDMLKASVADDSGNTEERRLQREIEQRKSRNAE